MNKKKLLALILSLTTLGVAGHAQATNLFYNTNKDGGVIMLTDIKEGCTVGQRMYTTTSGGVVSDSGCWTYEEPFVKVKYDDEPNVRSYNAGAFSPTAEAKRRFPQ